jgi:rubrerythrin
VGLWEHIQSVLSTAFRAFQGPSEDAQVQWQAWLSEAWRTEQRLSHQLHHIAPRLPYEQYRRCLEGMAQDDSEHANLLRQQLEIMGGGSAPQPLGTAAVGQSSAVGGVYKNLQRVLVEKRELYESYRQQVNRRDDPGLQALLRHLQQDQDRHQEQLIDLLMKLDAHVHDTIT